MALLMFALQQPYCFTLLRLRFQVACSIIFPNPTLPLIAAEEPLINITS